MVKDDLEAVLTEIEATDILVISTPVYVWDIPGQLKCFIDRLFSFLKPDFHNVDRPSRLSEGKKVVFIQTQGASEEKFQNIYEKYETLLGGMLGFSEVYTIRQTDLVGPVHNVSVESFERAEELALRIV